MSPVSYDSFEIILILSCSTCSDASHQLARVLFAPVCLCAPSAEHSGQADQEDEPGSGGGEQQLERAVR